MVRSCCVKGCPNRMNRVPGVSYFSFPFIKSTITDVSKKLLIERRRQKWIEAVGRFETVGSVKWEPKKHSKVCSAHFVAGFPTSNEDEKNVDWVPTLKLPGIVSGVDKPANKWKDWITLVNQMVSFLKTGKFEAGLSSAKQKEISEAAQVYYIESGVIYRRKNRQTRVVVISVDERDSIIEKAHRGELVAGTAASRSSSATGIGDAMKSDGTNDHSVTSSEDNEEKHCDADATVIAIKSRYFWKGVKSDVANWIRRCMKCSPTTAAEELAHLQTLRAVVLSGSENEDDDDDDDDECKIVAVDPSRKAKRQQTKLTSLHNIPSSKPVQSQPMTAATILAQRSNTASRPLSSPIVISSKSVPNRPPSSCVKITLQPPNVTMKGAPGNKLVTVVAQKVASGLQLKPIKMAPASVNKGPSILRKGPPVTPKKAKSLILKPLAPKPTTPSSAQPVPSLPKSYRPVAWLLHGIGIRLVREHVYGDLIAIQEQKEAEGQLGSAEQAQLAKLCSAHADLVQKNAYLSNGSDPVQCRCGFTALLRCELELHRDYGHPSYMVDSGRYDCCQCGAVFNRSAAWIATHNERVHGRHARSYTPPPPPGICPYCPFEMRTNAKFKLTRHIERCSTFFSADQNLMLLPADCDFPLIETRPPSSASSLTTVTVTTALAKSSAATTVTASSTVAKPSEATLNTSCNTVSTVDCVSTPIETTPQSAKSAVKSKGRLQLPHDSSSLPFQVCELCGALLRNRQSMVLHLVKAHRIVIHTQCTLYDSPPIHCSQCTERFWTPHALNQHVIEMHRKQDELMTPVTTVCPVCKRTRLTNVMEHLARQHRITLVDMFLQRYCSVCQVSLHSVRPFENHMLTRHADLFADRAALYAALVTVDNCTRGRQFCLWRGRQLPILGGAVRKPMVGEAAEECVSCPTCGMEFSNDVEQKSHAETAHSFVCTFCSRRFMSSRFLEVHVGLTHADETLSCSLCDEEVKVGEMVGHMTLKHVQSCSVRAARLAVEDVVRKRCHSVSSSDSDHRSETIEDEHDSSAPKRIRLEMD